VFLDKKCMAKKGILEKGSAGRSDRFRTRYRSSVGYQADHVLNDIKNAIGPPVQQEDIAAKNDSAPNIRNLRETLLQFIRKRLHSLLQAGRKRTVTLKVFLKTGGKVAASLGQSRGEPLGMATAIIFTNHPMLFGQESFRASFA
jgi:hypothetical protein